MKIKSQEDDTTHLSEWLPSKRQQITSVSEDMEKRELWCTVDDIVNSIAPTIENSIDCLGDFPQNLKIELSSHNPAVSLLGNIFQQKIKTLIW